MEGVVASGVFIKGSFRNFRSFPDWFHFGNISVGDPTYNDASLPEWDPSRMVVADDGFQIRIILCQRRFDCLANILSLVEGCNR